MNSLDSRTKTDKAAKASIERDVTDRILVRLKDLKDNPQKWEKPWDGFLDGLPLRASGANFTGINVWLLMFAGFSDVRWYTFDQAKEALGYTKNPLWTGKADTFKGIQKWVWSKEGEDPRHGVRKGEKGTPAVRISVTPLFKDQDGTRVYPPKGDKTAWNARLASGQVVPAGSFTKVNSYTVFNAEQIEGIPALAAVPKVDPAERFAAAEAAIAKLNANIQHVEGGNVACYRPGMDSISLPAPGQFKTLEDYMATKFHEVIHWTGHESRCNRTFGTIFGTPEYAFEELVAELGAAFLCAHFGIEGKLQHPEYLASWIKKLDGDEKAIFRAASMAQKATDYILGVKDDEPAENDSEEGEA